MQGPLVRQIARERATRRWDRPGLAPAWPGGYVTSCAPSCAGDRALRPPWPRNPVACWAPRERSFASPGGQVPGTVFPSTSVVGGVKEL